MEKYAVVLHTDAKNEIIDMTKERQVCPALYSVIGCDTVEFVNPQLLERPYALAVDEEGLLKGVTYINPVASYLYKTHIHGNPIVGVAVLIKLVNTDDGPDYVFLQKDEAEKMKSMFDALVETKLRSEDGGLKFPMTRDALITD